jgi:hypothetical protein
MSRYAPGRSPWLAVAPWVLAACGSRTPLLDDPGPLVVSEAGSVIAPQPGPLPEAEPAFPCIVGSRPVRSVQIDLTFMLDKSRSMNDRVSGSQTKWQAVSAALDSFLDAPESAGLKAGISFFPRQESGSELCSPSEYTYPVVDFDLLPGVAASIKKAIAVQTLLTGTPMTPALEGAHLDALRYWHDHPSDSLAVVLVTDGIPHQCSSSVATTSAVAATHSATQTPSVKTYVLGVGPSLGSLNAIAAAGGTTGAYLVDKGGESGLLAALEAIRTSALACEYVFPPGTNTRFDLATVTTQTGSDAGPTSVNRVDGAEACAGGQGWFYDSSAEQTVPTRITLCPASCQPLVDGTDSHLDVRVGCVDDDR